ncbi:hypothetical protein B6U96_12265 [Archaeoglobales archaeon ex4484_92]|nr:MAG: hypothetical protein B6U96_12265 [Archaeoglobales archaeon ex4484_92]
MDEFNYILVEDEDEIEICDEAKLAEIYQLATKLLRLLDEIKSVELKESASLMLIKELIRDNRVLLGLVSKMLQDMSFGFDEDENYVS